MEHDEIPIGRAENLKGQKFGKLTVLYRVKSPEHIKSKCKPAYWKCVCECGNTIITSSKSLKSNNIKSCGCIKNFKDETGNRYGKLLVLKRNGSKNGRPTWLCQCDCGNTIITTGQNLRRGYTKSCGCLQKEFVKKLNYIPIEPGTRFGHLTIIEQVSSDKYGQTRYRCKCDCGSETISRANDLRRGKSQSCGCVRSMGEIKITDLLLSTHKFFVKEYTFSDLHSKLGYNLKFDFFVDNKYLIEFDGIQHFKAFKDWGGENKLKLIQQHDQIKNEYCKTHNIPLIRIPYWHYDKITIDDLHPETSQFLIT